MRFRTHEATLPWTSKSHWMWPAEDRKLVGVFHQVADIDNIMKHSLLSRRRVCIQAGGACGVWPLRFSMFFERVYTFEPQPDNYACLLENTKATDGWVIAEHAALSDKYQRVAIQNDVSERDNWGAGYIVPNPNGVPTRRIDDLDLDACDLICLDVEGAELDALKGGTQTIRKYRPLICLEDKPLPHLDRFGRQVGDPERWLYQFGYTVVERVHRDVILSC